jgi:hypothetical protein
MGMNMMTDINTVGSTIATVLNMDLCYVSLMISSTPQSTYKYKLVNRVGYPTLFT